MRWAYVMGLEFAGRSSEKYSRDWGQCLQRHEVSLFRQSEVVQCDWNAEHVCAPHEQGH